MQSLTRGSFALLFFLLISCAVLFVPKISFAADILFAPATATFPLGKEFTIKVTVDPGTASINAADGQIIFDKDILSVSNVTKDGSAFSLWTADPTFDNAAGTITFSGGTPSAFAKVGNVITITFKGKAQGAAKASVSKGSVLAADGKGTNVFSKGGEAAITIGPAEVAAPVDAPPDESAGPTPLAPTIDSPTYSKPDSWYNATTGLIVWKLQPDVTDVRILLSDKEDATPNQDLKSAATSTTITNVKDGVSFFLAQFKNDSGWGETGKRKIQVDTVPPVEFDVGLVEPAEKGGTTKLTFKSDDALSGLDRYEIVIGSSTIATVKPSDVTDGTFPVPPQGGGSVLLTIKAYDKAGNVRIASKQLTLPKVDKPTKTADGEAPPVQQSGWTIERILTILFALTIGVLGTRYYMFKKVVVAEKSRLLKRVSEINDKNDRVFSAMREEFEQMINDLDVKPQLTPAERDFLENVKEVLEISEELIDTSIEELKKQIRGQ